MTITHLHQVAPSPLCWPENKPRAASRIGGPFKNRTLTTALEDVRRELRRWGALDHVISLTPPYGRIGEADPGVAVWWAMPVPVRGTDAHFVDLRVLACDTYTRHDANAHAIAVTLEGLRAFERYGTYTKEQAIEGAKPALLAPPGGLDWRKVLGWNDGLPDDKQLVLVEHSYRSLSREAAGNEDRQRELNGAIEAARRDLGA